MQHALEKPNLAGRQLSLQIQSLPLQSYWIFLYNRDHPFISHFMFRKYFWYASDI